MMFKRAILIFLGGIFLMGLVGADVFGGSDTGGFGGSSTSSWQYSQPNFNNYYSNDQINSYWPILNDIENDQCTAYSDFLISIRPGGCTPMVVRSDLLEEQNVPVFCQLDAIRVNPLIKVSSIKSISFSNKEVSDQIAGISFHPARAAIKSHRTLLGSPLLNNIGYVVIVLKQNKIEDEMPDWIYGNLTATINYDVENAYGTGRAEYYAPVMSDEDWSSNYGNYGFWYGRGYVRVTDIEQGGANVELYTGKDNLFQSIVLKEGETSSPIYFPGFYCKAALKVKLDDIVAPAKEARLNIDGQDFWVREGSKILGNCKIKDIAAVEGGMGSISISCPGQKVDLILQNSGALISTGGFEKEYGVGDFVDKGKIKKDGKERDGSLYLGYLGEIPKTVSESSGEDFILLVSPSSGGVEDADLADISQKVGEVYELQKGKTINLDSFEDKLGKAVSGSFGTGSRVYLIVKGKSDVILDDEQIDFVGLAELKDREGDATLDYYFDEAKETTDILVDEYGLEEGNIESFGEVALIELARLAEVVEKPNTAKELYTRFIERYADSKNIEGVRNDLYRVSNYDTSRAMASIFLNNEFHDLRVEQFKAFDPETKKALVSVGSFDNWAFEGDKIGFGSNPAETGGESYVILNEIKSDKVIFKYYEYDESKGKHKSSETISLEERDSVFRDEVDIVVRQLKVDKVAKISLIPDIKNTKTKANFTFRIGIEKRAIELSPEKTKDMIKNLNKTISDWEDINDKLGNVIRGWKGACFATSSLLMIKNLVSGFNGESLARQRVMKSYRDICAREHSEKSRTQCYNDLASDINRDVALMQKGVEDINKEISVFEASNKLNDGFLGTGKVVDGEKTLDEYRSDFKRKYETDSITIFVEGKEVEVDIDDINSFEQLREADLLRRLETSGVRSEVLEDIQGNLDDGLNSLYRLQESKRNVAELEKNLGSGIRIPVTILSRGENEFSDKNGRFSKTELLGALQNSEGVASNLEGIGGNEIIGAQVVYVGSQGHLYLFERKEGSEGRPLGIFKLNSGGTSKYSVGEEIEELPVPTGASVGAVSKSETGNCVNKYLEPRVRYYETSPNVRLPAIVPLDLENGWYVKISQSVGGLFESQEKGYQASGDVSKFYICNVGENGREDNQGKDDNCQSFDVNTFDEVNSFGGCDLDRNAVQDLYSRARRVVREAAQQYGNERVKLTGIDQFLEVDQPLVGDGELIECQDFMSPEDCMLMFNVCDPVICPPSRCNLGGNWPVANVAQTGIIGSIALCLPNAAEGIVVPVCLTGIHAGIDNLVSIMKSSRECLQTSLETGEHVGICDEITSIYLCEFFWRQIAPIIRYFIPRVIESAYGFGGLQGARGGGEYLTVMDSWNSFEKNIEFFKGVYAQNAFRAFQFRSVEEAGGTVCKAFIGTSLPTSASILDSLLAPESPEQVSAWFSEVPFSDVTVPATSQYKVYYHIYAGNDKGVQYSVYLRDPPATSYYSVNPIVQVKSGYIQKGNSVDIAEDFTAPAGYKEMCINLDAVTHCGFRQVSTDFGLQYLEKKYIEDQADNRDIASEKECISGSPSIYGMVNPNIQAGFEESVQPEIALRGIVRICATENPGLSVSGSSNNSRWTEVGYCDSTNIRCWLDRESVREDLEMVKSVDGTLEEYQAELAGFGEGVLLPNATRDEIGKIREFVDGGVVNGGLKISLTGNVLRGGRVEIDKVIDSWIDRLDRLTGERESGRAFSNQDIAEALSLKALIYRTVVSELWSSGVVKSDPVGDVFSGAALTGANDLVSDFEDGEENIFNEDYSDFDDLQDELDDYQSDYEEGESISVEVDGAKYFVKYAAEGFLGKLFGSKGWLFSTDEKNWNKIDEKNTKLGELAEKNFGEGLVEIEKDRGIKLVVESNVDESKIVGDYDAIFFKINDGLLLSFNSDGWFYDDQGDWEVYAPINGKNLERGLEVLTSNSFLPEENSIFVQVYGKNINGEITISEETFVKSYTPSFTGAAARMKADIIAFIDSVM
jgi:hypothetical protein